MDWCKQILRILYKTHEDTHTNLYTDPEVIELFPCSTHLSMKFFLLINVKMPTIVGILTFMNRKNSILAYLSPKNAKFLDMFIPMSN